MNNSGFKIGVDGGGIKTELILVDPTGTIVSTHLAPGCNPSQCGQDQARTILSVALADLVARSKSVRAEGLITATHLYLAGSPVFWHEFATSLTGLGAVVSAPDSVPVLELATQGAPGLVLHAGTGSFVASRAPDGSIHYSGGLGWKLGDAGSGFDLGRRAIAIALLEMQTPPSGHSPSRSPLVEALCQHTGLSDYAANSQHFYTDPSANALIADFAPRVLELAKLDYGPARQVVMDSVTDLVRLANQVIHRHFPDGDVPLPCGISGRILNSVPAISVVRSLAGQFCQPVELNFINTPPIEGVRRLLTKEG